MKWQSSYTRLLFAILTGFICTGFSLLTHDHNDKLKVRIAELEIEPEHLTEYLQILKDEAAASMLLEPGVISIYPMYEIDNPHQITIIEIYRNNNAYLSHLETPHFKHYKSTTVDMVKSLKLVDMQSIDEKSMPQIFTKLH